MGFSLSGGPYQYNRFEVLSEKAKPDFLDMDKDGDKKESMKKAIKEKGCGCKKEPCECKKEDFEAWANSLIEEGFDLSEWTWDGLHETYLEIIESKSYVPGAKVGVKVKKGPALKENRFAAYGGKDTDAGAKYAKPSKSGDKKGVYEIKGKDGKPLFKKEELCQYLMDEGYTNNEVSAEVLFNHMSDEWLNSVVGNIEEKYMDPTKSRRLGGMSPNMKMNAKTIELQKSEPGSKREKKQTKATNQMNRTLHSGANMARRRS